MIDWHSHCHLLEPAVRRESKNGMIHSFKSLFAGDSRHLHDAGETGNALLDYLRNHGCSFLGNLGSFTGFYGRQVKTAAETMKELGIYDRFGSDLHSPKHAEMILESKRTAY